MTAGADAGPGELADALLKRLDGTTQERLINWGYAICDTGMRTWVVSGVSKPARLPFTAAGLA